MSQEDEIREDPNNVAFFCPDHSPKPMGMTEWPVPAENFIGAMVKKGFEVNGAVPGPNGKEIPVPIEAMWVQVTGVDILKKTLTGKVKNDSFFGGPPYDSEVQIRLEEVIDASWECSVCGKEVNLSRVDFTRKYRKFMSHKCKN